MSKHDNRGRSAREPRHVRLYHWVLESAAYQSLDSYGRALLVEFKKRYTGNNNGDIGFSGSEMERALGCSNGPADRALRDLIDRGFVKLSQKGSFSWKRAQGGGSRASTWTLTEYPIDWPERSAMPATKDFMRWRPKPAPTKKSRGENITPMGVGDHPINGGMGVGDHPNGVTRSPHEAQNRDADGVRISPPYSIPDTAPGIEMPTPSEETDLPMNSYARAKGGY